MSSTAVLADPIAQFLAGEMPASGLPDPKWGPIGQEVYDRTYSRDLEVPVEDSTGTRTKETWAETVRRVVVGNLGFVDASTHQPGEAVELFELIYNFGGLPGGRHLWVTGTSNPFSRNCFVSGWSERTSDHLVFLTSRLFEGGGVGANYSNDLLASTQPIVGTLDVSITCRTDHPDFDVVRTAADGLWAEWPAGETVTVSDTREGWVGCWQNLVDLACTPGRHQVCVDVSDLRHHGAPLRTFGGQASGPAPLATSIVEVTRILNGAAADSRRLSSLEAMNVDHHCASAIVAGGARRSARMSLKSWRDHDIFEFIHCKTDPNAHWSTNISVEVDNGFWAGIEGGDPHAIDVLNAIALGMARDGEPGIVDTDQMSVGERTAIRATNPCGEVGLVFDPADAAGEACNLGSVNLDHFGDDHAGACRAFELIARFLYRATCNPYPDEAASRIEAHNRRIGVGFMGLQGWAAAHGTRLSQVASTEALRSKLTEFRHVVRRAADGLADEMGLPRPVKVTAIAPTGTIAQMPGVTPGIQPVFARHLIRRVRYADTDPALPGLVAEGYSVLDDTYAANTKVVEYPVRDSILDRFDEGLIEQADELAFGDFMALVACVQETFCGGSDGNAVSSTAHLPANADPAMLAAEIVKVGGSVKGVTAFPAVSRPLSPLEAISKDTFEEMVATVGIAESFDSNDGSCSTGACPVR